MYQQRSQIVSNAQKISEILKNRNDEYIKAAMAEFDDEDNEESKPGDLAASKNQSNAQSSASLGVEDIKKKKKKVKKPIDPSRNLQKSPSLVRTEQLQKLFDRNVPGKIINERELPQVHPSLTKKLDMDHFRHRNASMVMAHTAGSNELFTGEDSFFDGTGATNLMSSKHTQSRMNSLFLDTNLFNTSSTGYVAELNQPGALERLNEYGLDGDKSILRRKSAVGSVA